MFFFDSLDNVDNQVKNKDDISNILLNNVVHFTISLIVLYPTIKIDFTIFEKIKGFKAEVNNVDYIEDNIQVFKDFYIDYFSCIFYIQDIEVFRIENNFHVLVS